jgi:UDP-glucose 4-epimerase
MKILVTGGAGFIGSHTVDCLIKSGHQVRVLDNLTSGMMQYVNSNADFFEKDILGGFDSLLEVMTGVDAVLHLAALVSVPASILNPFKAYEINTLGTAKLLEAARISNVGRFVLASTCSVYGVSSNICTEDSPLNPLVPYATSKLMSEYLLDSYSSNFSMETVRLRYFNVYGDRQSSASPYSGVIAKWCNNAASDIPCEIYGDGEQTRDFISVRDVANANRIVLTESLPHLASCYNVCTGESFSLNYLLDVLESTLLKPVTRIYHSSRAGDIRHSMGGNSALKKLDWYPAVSFEEGLKELLNVSRCSIDVFSP